MNADAFYTSAQEQMGCEITAIEPHTHYSEGSFFKTYVQLFSKSPPTFGFKKKLFYLSLWSSSPLCGHVPRGQMKQRHLGALRKGKRCQCCDSPLITGVYTTMPARFGSDTVLSRMSPPMLRKHNTIRPFKTMLQCVCVRERNRQKGTLNEKERTLFLSIE